MQDALVGMGSSKAFGPLAPARIVARAAGALASLGSVTCSSLYASPSWPDPSRAPYVNAVAVVRTSLTPETMLAALLAIEAGFGRVRDAGDRYAPRTLDLDLLVQGDERRESARLTLPHPKLAERDFVLLPLREVAPGFVHPLTGAGVDALIGALAEVTAERFTKGVQAALPV